VTGYTLGVHLDSVTLETASAAYYTTMPSAGRGTTCPIKLDRYGAHTHPMGTSANDGDYHYHQVNSRWSSNPKEHSPIVGLGC